MKKLLFLVFLTLLTFSSCNKPKLNGHYHLEWMNDNISSFQTWNIQNNQYLINEELCLNKDSICDGFPISFTRDSMKVHWVDILYTSKYTIDSKGVVYLEGDDRNSPLRLTPHKNCLTSKEYFKQRLDTLSEKFSLPPNDYKFNKRVFPKNAKNELIIGPLNEDLFCLFNGKLITMKEAQELTRNKTKEELWAHIDETLKLKDILPVLTMFYDKNFEISFTTAETSENNEQLGIQQKSISQIRSEDQKVIINSCEYCEKFSDMEVKSTFQAEIIGPDQCVIDGKETDFFQLRNQLVRYLGQNRTTRLQTQIELRIDANLLFKDYIDLINELDFVHTELYNIAYYRGKDDPDQKWIHEAQWNNESGKVYDQFPIRIQETFTH